MQIENKLAVIILCGGKGTRLGAKFKNTNNAIFLNSYHQRIGKNKYCMFFWLFINRKIFKKNIKKKHNFNRVSKFYA